MEKEKTSKNTEKYTDEELEVLSRYDSLSNFGQLQARAALIGLATAKGDQVSDALKFVISLKEEDRDKVELYAKLIAEQMVNEIREKMIDLINANNEMFA
jgi:hypothetical protein